MVIVAVKVTLVPAQMVVPGLALMDTVGTKTGFTVIVSVLLVTKVGVAQTALEVSSQVIVLPLVKPASVYVALLVPTATPFFFHW